MELINSDIKKVSSVITEYYQCRICHGEDITQNLLEPCSCKGTIGHVHKQCLESWFKRSGMARCDLCLFTFEIISKRKFSMLQSIWIWITHPSTRKNFWYDLGIFVLLAIITVAALGATLYEMDVLVFVEKNTFFDQSEIVIVSICFGATLICTIVNIWMFSSNVVTFYRFQIQPWYYWWRTSTNIHLKLW